jgi:phosphocarrier protein HPr
MIEKIVKIEDPTGLHARPASQLCKQSQKFSSKITIIYEDKYIDAKSILNVLASGIKGKCDILIRCEGADETLALDSLVDLVASLKG